MARGRASIRRSASHGYANAAVRRPARMLHGRIVAAGLGAGTMFGLVALFGFASSAAGDVSAPAPAESATGVVVPPPLKIVIHRPAVTSPASSLPASTMPVEPSSTSAEVAADPIVLTAEPMVRTVTVTVPGRSSGATAQSPAPSPATSRVSTGGSS
jgi:hypothetical protein